MAARRLCKPSSSIHRRGPARVRSDEGRVDTVIKPHLLG